MPISAKYINYLILLLLMPVLIVDMLNGIMLEKGIELPVSVSQLYKLGILGLMIYRIAQLKEDFFTVKCTFVLLILSSIVMLFYGYTIMDFINDFIKIFKYLTPLIAFFFFRSMFRSHNFWIEKKFFTWITVSYWILVANILLKLVGVGYPMYDAGGIGTRGFFHAGNEISVLLLVLSAIKGYQIWNFSNSKLTYLLFLFLNVFLGILVTSKTGILGTVVVFCIIAFEPSKFKLTFRQIRTIFISILMVIPMIVYFVYKFVSQSDIMIRFTYFWEKLDFLTFVLSSRNLYVEKMLMYYDEEYMWWQKIIGGGQTNYEEMLGHIIEIDFIDLYFAYGLIVLVLFIYFLYYLIANAKNNSRKTFFPFARLTFIMSVLLIFLSSLSGHVFNSGIAGMFIGGLFAMMCIQRPPEIQDKVIETTKI